VAANAAGLGVDIIMPEVEAAADDDAFEYWAEGHEAVMCFSRYLSDQWIYSFGGVAALDVSQALAVIGCLHKHPANRLRLLEEVKAVAAGVLKYIHEKQKTCTE
jgi:hypothetical protein